MLDFDAYWHLRKGGTGTLPLPDRALWKLSGPDRVRYLNGQVTQDIARLAPGHAWYAALCTAKGRMEGDLFVAASPDALWLDGDGACADRLAARIEKYLIADDAVLEPLGDAWSLAHVFNGTGGSFEGDVMAFRSRRFGLPGFDVWCPSGAACQWGRAVTPEVAETLRIEHGLALWGSDMDEKTLPPEAGLDRHGISYTKGCYVGQETIARIKSIGHVNRQLVVLAAVDAAVPPLGGTMAPAETPDAPPVGKITSAAFSPTLEKGIALAYVPRQHARLGASFSMGGSALTIIDPPLPW